MSWRTSNMSQWLVLAAAIGCGDASAGASSTLAPANAASAPTATMAAATAAPSSTAGRSAVAVVAAAAAGSAGAAATPLRTSVPQSGSSAQAGSGAALLDSDAGMAEPMGEGTAPSDTRGNCTVNAYVSNSGSDSVSVIDTTTNKVVATVPTGKAPVNPTFTPDRRFVYVSNSQDNTITVINVDTNETSTIPATGDRPSGLAFSPDGKTLFVSLISQDYTSPGSLLSIELSTGKTSPSIGMGADPERIALTPDGQRLFVNNLLDGTMAVVDVPSNKIIATLMLGDLPFNPLMSPDGSVVYVGVMSANHIAVIDTKTNKVLRTVPANSPNGVSFSADFQDLFVSNALDGTVQQVSLTMDKVLNTQSVGGIPGNLAVLPDGNHAYMVRPEGSTVEVLDTSTLMIVETITVEDGPSVVTVCRNNK